MEADQFITNKILCCSESSNNQHVSIIHFYWSASLKLVLFEAVLLEESQGAKGYFGCPALNTSFHKSKAIQVAQRQKLVACGTRALIELTAQLLKVDGSHHQNQRHQNGEKILGKSGKDRKLCTLCPGANTPFYSCA